MDSTDETTCVGNRGIKISAYSCRNLLCFDCFYFGVWRECSKFYLFPILIVMKKFLRNILLVIGIPVLIVFGLYWVTDPFKVNRPFTLDNASDVNREYVSTELFLKQYPKYKYNSYIFGSSRACGLNTYVWKDLLENPHLQNDTVSQFLFQAWAETIVGINQKVRFLDKNNIQIKNALVLIDFGSSFQKNSFKALDIKHFELSGQSKFGFYKSFIMAYYEKPSKVIKSVADLFDTSIKEPIFDTISNDHDKSNKYGRLECPMPNYTVSKSKFPNKRAVEELFAQQNITSEYEEILKEIKEIFIKHNTYYKLFVTPEYSQININQCDLKILEDIFGKENVSDFSGKNSITEDKYNFMDVNHFDANAGWDILHAIYDKQINTNNQ